MVIKDNLNPTDEVKTDAAELAAYYSKARLSNLVQVDMIDVKKLNKPTAGKPGFVTYTGQKPYVSHQLKKNWQHANEINWTFHQPLCNA